METIKMKKYITNVFKKNKIYYIDPIIPDDIVYFIYRLYSEGINLDFRENSFNSEKLGLIYYYHGIYFHINKDYTSTLAYFLSSYSHGNHDACYTLGNYFRKITKDYISMKKWYNLGIDHGKINLCAFELGVYYEKIEKDYHLMKKYYKLSINAGNSFAMVNLALSYKRGEKSNNLKMIKYLEKACEFGNPFAFYYLGVYYNSINEERESANLFETASSFGHGKASYRLGIMMLSYGEEFIAIEYFIKGVNQNHTPSMIELGDLYRQNIYRYCNYLYPFCKFNEENVRKLFLKACEYKNLDRSDYLADYYYSKRIENNYDEIINFIIKYKVDNLKKKEFYLFLPVNNCDKNFKFTHKLLFDVLEYMINKKNMDNFLCCFICTYLKKLISNIDVHFEFSFRGIQYDIIKNNFENLVNEISK